MKTIIRIIITIMIIIIIITIMIIILIIIITIMIILIITTTTTTTTTIIIIIMDNFSIALFFIRNELRALGRVVSVEACCQWAILSVQITGLVTLPTLKFTVQEGAH